ncbi:protease [Gossypium australe]|uniref:Protease n=1 Tax=Gossypium australe TaxID=47621 RepID=A0A5B6W8W0_9ROSI|nr:protease [Gossypium australe]
MMVNKVIKNYPLIFGEHTFLANLFLLSFHEFDAVLRLDWLTRHSAIVDYRARDVRLLTVEGKELLLLSV